MVLFDNINNVQTHLKSAKWEMNLTARFPRQVGFFILSYRGGGSGTDAPARRAPEKKIINNPRGGH